jgi:hypothetical protein
MDSRAETFKICGSSRLQTIDEVNANRRIYRMAICERFVDAANEKIKGKRMIGELDHPMPTDVNEAMQLRRQVSVLWERASHIFTRMWIENKQILGITESLSNRNGIDMARVAAIDGLPVGFSCRAVGKTKSVSGMQGVVEVVNPVLFVTYDCVTDPSHKNCVLTDITNVIHSAAEMKRLSENVGLDVALDESEALASMCEFFYPGYSTMRNFEDLLENVMTGKISVNLPEQKAVKVVKNKLDNLLEDFLNTSDKKTGISSDPFLNESNVHDVMREYSETHRTLNTVDEIKNLLKKNL